MSKDGPASLDDAPRLAALIDNADAGSAVLFAASPVAQAIVDREGRLLRANPALARLVGEGGQLDDSPLMAELFMPVFRAEVQRALRLVLAGADPAGIGRAIPLAPTGIGTVDLLAAAIHEADGRIAGALLHLCDVSGRTGLDAQPALRAAGVAHDANNLLAVIAATVAEALARPGLDGATLEDLAGIGDATRRAAGLLRRLLDDEAHRPGAVALGIDAALLAMEAPLRRVLGGIAFTLAPGLAGALVALGPGDLGRVVMGLAVNARNAMPSGGTLVVSSSARDVAGTVSQFGGVVVPGRYVVVTVRDTGTGMSPDVMARLFEPFFTTRAGQGGTGLGLASVRDLVRQAGGFLEVTSESCEGTTVRVHLPRHDAVPADLPGLAADGDLSRAASCGKGVVLLVDDEAVLLRVAERALVRAGWHVIAVSSAADALAAVDDAVLVPCVMVTDLMLPDADGLALVDKVRCRIPGLPAVLTSGYASTALRGRTAEAGVAFLGKPYGMAALLDQMAASLQPRR